MKKAIIISSFVFLATAGFAYAAEPNGNPFTSIWLAIGDLQQQVKNIQLIPGPKGDTGAQGVQGPKGDTGIQGVPGTDIRTSTVVMTGGNDVSMNTQAGIIVTPEIFDSQAYGVMLHNPYIHPDSNIIATVTASNLTRPDTILVINRIYSQSEGQAGLFVGTPAQPINAITGHMEIHYLILNR